MTNNLQNNDNYNFDSYDINDSCEDNIEKKTNTKEEKKGKIKKEEEKEGKKDAV